MKLENYTFDEKATKILEKLNSNGNKGYLLEAVYETFF